MTNPTRLQLYHFAASGNCRAVRLVLAEKGLAFTRVEIDVTRGDNRTPAFLALNPRGKVPVLVDNSPMGEVVLAEVSVINEYLDEAFPLPALMPAGAAARARVRALVHLFDTELSPTVGPLIIEQLLRPAGQRRAEFIAERQAATRALLQRLIGMVDREGPFLAGSYSLADPLYTPLLSVMESCGVALEEFAPLTRWLAAVQARPSYAASAS
ncbi:MAG TPA: glutathione S-transferase family protein [Candidatus Binataceae bacterium]|nr:glutathione S-transferase family protein [Candidatus Binataceae bacterium]